MYNVSNDTCNVFPHILTQNNNMRKQWDRVQEQTVQGSHHQTGHRIVHTFTTIQTTEQWED